ncbi:MAG TPA: hypothetical protein DGN60_08710 [Chloroflexi bacterium]|nr:hypothetical protein [Chloroflexota bacterium]
MLKLRPHIFVLALAGLLSISTACDAIPEIGIQTSDEPAQKIEKSLATQDANGNVFWTLYATVLSEDIYARRSPNKNSEEVLRLAKDVHYTAIGRSEDGLWIQIVVPEDNNELWLPNSSVSLSGEIEKLASVSDKNLPKTASTATSTIESSPTSIPSNTSTSTATITITNTAIPTTLVPATFTPEPTATNTLPPTATLEPTSTYTPAPTATAIPPTTAPVPTAAPILTTGNFELGGQVSDFRAPDIMKNAGMTWVKRQVKWHPGEAASGHFGTITDAHGKGFKILLSVLGSPDQSYPHNFDEYARFTGELAGAGADAIEVWNEMNIEREWASGSINPSSYTSLLQKAHTSIKTYNSGTMVISGAPAPTGYFGGCHPHGCDDAPYIAGMVAAGGLNYLDCVGIHYNEGIMPPSATSGDPRGASGHYTRYYQSMVDTYYNAIGGARPLCFTEIGYLSGEEWGTLPPAFLWQPPYNLSAAQHAQYLADAVRISRVQGKVRLFIIFNVDFTHWSDDPQAGFAMLRPGGNCPSCGPLQAAMSGN